MSEPVDPGAVALELLPLILKALVDGGALKIGALEDLARGLDMQADETRLAAKRGRAMMAADIVRLAIMLCERNVTPSPPGLRIVKDDDA